MDAEIVLEHSLCINNLSLESIPPSWLLSEKKVVSEVFQPAEASLRLPLICPSIIRKSKKAFVSHIRRHASAI